MYTREPIVERSVGVVSLQSITYVSFSQTHTPCCNRFVLCLRQIPYHLTFTLPPTLDCDRNNATRKRRQFSEQIKGDWVSHNLTTTTSPTQYGTALGLNSEFWCQGDEMKEKRKNKGKRRRKEQTTQININKYTLSYWTNGNTVRLIQH